MGIAIFPGAATGPTLAEINNSVATNASRFGGTLTYLGKLAPTSGNSVSYTGLSSYKYLKLAWVGGQTAATVEIRLRINNDSANNYSFFSYGVTTSTAHSKVSQSNNVSFLFLSDVDTAGRAYGVLEIENSNSASLPKHITMENSSFDGSAQYTQKTNAIYEGTSAIDSIQLYLYASSYAFGGNNGFHLWGGN